jgi:mRNA interferase RelE/StbE
MHEIHFTDPALDDLRRLGPEAVPRVLRKVLLLEQNPEAGPPLGGSLTGFRTLVVGRNTWRVVYRVAGPAVEICEIWAVGHRRDAEVYAEALARVRDAARVRPELVVLADVVRRLGRMTGRIGPEPAGPPKPAPVPDWLAERLVRTVGLRRERVAALDLQRAVDLWADYVSGKPVELWPAGPDARKEP